LQRTATHCSVVAPATHCNTLRRTTTHCNVVAPVPFAHYLCFPFEHRENALQHTHCIERHRTASHCNALQRTATHCNALQRTATHCNALQRTAIPPAHYLRFLVENREDARRGDDGPGHDLADKEAIKR